MNLFSFVKSRISITDVVNDYTALKKAGMYYKASCPFHSEKTASFTVSPHKEIFYCFGCHAGGDVIAFIAKAENCSPLEAAQHLVTRYGIEVPASVADYKQEDHASKNRYLDLCKAVAQWCAQSLEHSPVAQRYFEQRGFTKDTLALFGIGYFPGGLHAMKSLITFAGTKKFIAADLLEAHLIEQGKQVLYSPFEERLIFPIKNHQGHVCGFGGRVFKEHDERAKYYNSRENDFFSKGSLLFGFDLAKKAAQAKGTLFLVEGYTDCMAMVQHGFTNTVATLGTACTIEHLKILARHAQKLFVLYDGDNAGHKAMLRLAELCWEVNLELCVVTLPAQEDPASFLTAGKDLSPHLHQAQDIFSFYVSSLGTDFARLALAEKLRTIHKLLGVLQTVNDPLKQELLLQQAAEAIGIPFSSLERELGRLQSKAPHVAAPVPSDSSDAQRIAINEGVDISQISLLEKKLFSVIVGDMSLLDKAHSDYVIGHFSQPLKSILERLIAGYKQGTVSFDAFFDSLPSHEQHIVAHLLTEYGEDTGAFEHLLIQFQKKHWKSIVQDIKIKLAHAEQEKNEQKIKDLLALFQELKKTLQDQGML